MSVLLSIETSTLNCSVSLSAKNQIIGLKEESSSQFIHSEKLHVFIEELIQETGVKIEDLEAVAVGKGPGSYTGLRIGVSAAKGLCYALKIPLISVDSLSILAKQGVDQIKPSSNDIILPMIDARRMEVYCAPFDSEGNPMGAVEAKVLDESTFSDIRSSRIHVLGDGAEKAKEVLLGEQFQFHKIPYPSASGLSNLAQEKLNKGLHEDLAYFEPWYFKDFVAGKPKKLL